MGLVAFVTLYPLYYVLILSLSSPQHAASLQVYWWPKGLYLGGYEKIVGDARIWMSYRNTILYALTQMVLMLLVCGSAAYALSYKNLKGRRVINTYLLIPMYFSGGIIPLFLLILNLGIYNTILIKAYFGSIPESMREAAMIDGASVYQIFGKIYIPLAKPILAVVALYTVIGVWNEWYKASLFITDQSLQPLQLYLRRILVEQSVDLSQDYVSQEQMMASMEQRMSNNQLKYCVIIVSSVPMLCAYPFFQKYFVKGVMLGSLKE